MSKSKILPPLLAFLVSRVFVSVCAWLTGFNPFRADTWLRWDSGHYVSIAQKGYEFVSCKSIGYPSTDDWCGNTGWFPTYPFLIRSFSFFFKDIQWAAVLLPPLFWFLTLYLLWNLFLDSKLNLRNVSVLLAAILFPGSIYFHAGFPVSLLAFLLLLSIHFVRHCRPDKAAMAGFFAALSYPTGVTIAGIPVLQFLISRVNRGNLAGGLLKGRLAQEFKNRLRGMLLVGGGCGLGVVGVFAIQQLQTGVWGAFLKAQHKYGLGQSFPFQSLLTRPLDLIADVPFSDPFWMHLQTVCVSVFMIYLLIFTLIRRERREDSLDSVLLSAGLIFWLFPHYLGGLASFYRSESLVLPMVVLLTRQPVALRFGVILVFGILAYFINRLFFTGFLV